MDQPVDQPITTRSGMRPESSASTSKKEATIPRRQLRSSTEAFLIGHTSSSISGAKLPTARQVLKYYLHQQQDDPRRYGDAATTSAVVNVRTFWTMARISTITEYNCKEKLRGLLDEWRLLKKSRGREGDAQKKARETFVSMLDKLWDIGAPDAIAAIKANRLLSEEDKRQDIRFYEDQQGPRLATMSGNDKIFQAKRERQLSRQQSASVSQPQPQRARLEAETATLQSTTCSCISAS